MFGSGLLEDRVILCMIIAVRNDSQKPAGGGLRLNPGLKIRLLCSRMLISALINHERCSLSSPPTTKSRKKNRSLLIDSSGFGSPAMSSLFRIKEARNGRSSALWATYNLPFLLLVSCSDTESILQNDILSTQTARGR